MSRINGKVKNAFTPGVVAATFAFGTSQALANEETQNEIQEVQQEEVAEEKTAAPNNGLSNDGTATPAAGGNVSKQDKEQLAIGPEDFFNFLNEFTEGIQLALMIEGEKEN